MTPTAPIIQFALARGAEYPAARMSSRCGQSVIVEVTAVIVAAGLLVWELTSDADEPLVDTERHR